MRFFGRDEEISMIREGMSRDHCFFVITGRRRIGKTRLIREALKGPDLLEFFIPRKRLSLALDQMSRSLKEQTGYSPSFSSMEEFFEYLLRMDGKIIFLDELSNLKFMDEGAFSDLQMLIDKYKDERRLRLIVDGSHISMMKKIFEDRKEPLFGRSTHLLELRPLAMEDSVSILTDSGFSFRDAMETYSLVGGVPRYLELIRYKKNIDDIRKSIFSPGSIFLPEGENVLIQEFGNSWDTYFSILEVISRGKFGPTMIADQLGMEVQMLPKYIKNLMDMRLVRRDRPILGKERHVRYLIDDPFFQLWFSVCYPRMEQFKNGIARIDKNTFADAIGRGIEKVIRTFLEEKGSIPFVQDGGGSWWDRSGNEVDSLFYSRKEKAILVGEIKWRNRPTGPDVVGDLLNNMEKIDWHNRKRTEYAFIMAREGFTEDAISTMKEEKVLGITVEDLERVINGDERIRWIPR